MLGAFWKPFSKVEEQGIIACIKQAESLTSGELKVHIDQWCKTNPVYKAQNIFHHLKMDTTKARNGVLIYLAIKEHQFAIIGDVGINEKVGQDFWDSTRDRMLEQFAKGAVVDGLCAGIEEAGKQLAKHFPIQDDDKNELSDDISYG